MVPRETEVAVGNRNLFQAIQFTTMKRMKFLLTVAALLGCGALGWCDDATSVTAEQLQALTEKMNIVWVLLGGILVFTMQAGFAMVETGLTRAKNAANIMMKNLQDFCMGGVAYFLVGSALMFGKSAWGLIGTDGWMMNILKSAQDWNWTFLFFQTMFCATAATIVSGAVAERIKFSNYLIYSLLVSLIIYPIEGKWCWGGLAGAASEGWLGKLGFIDFAGSTVVHSCGGWIALAGAIMLGPRLGKYSADGRPHIMPGHNLVIATLGVFLLWIGWFGFNPCSTLAATGDIGRIAMTTNMSACTASLSAMFTAWIVLGKPDLSMTLNGALAGLVAITAPCNTVSLWGSFWIGIIAGILVIFAVTVTAYPFLYVIAVSVHCVNGVFGTLACGLFNCEAVLGLADQNTGLFYGGGFHQLGIQALGALSVGAWAFGLGMLMFWAIKHTVGLRVSPEVERKGLDIVEHGNDGYYGFQIFGNE